ncbi:MAG: bifunctional phosphoribosylaminoimidazolecarboxamide formyltransferase/IMP cyclohydrolase [Trueperaceae bacterium]|nr:bifunctional phosphoribosylaminoimidazolecarboxamide formyltransferase/IMP cyclohydrolase [Trueperaceae bacterium]
MPRALLSVSDKTGLVEFASALVALGYEIVATGGTKRALAEAGLPVTAVADVTGAPEILGGRVKTLHPAIHGALLALPTQAHDDELARHGLTRIDLVAVNLYPFRETVAREGVTDAEAMENLDIGGPTMIRAAAKNHARVLVVVDPADYDAVVADLRAGEVPLARRRELARAAFAHTAAYDAAIVGYLDGDEALPPTRHLTLERAEVLRYGENPHQAGARYREAGRSGWWDGVLQHGGLALSYLNLFDADAAWRLAHAFPGRATAVVVKHANPCGVAAVDGGDGGLAEAYERAFDADPKSAFGGVVALNGVVDLALAETLVANPKADVLIAAGYEEAARDLLVRKRKNMRVLEAAAPGPAAFGLRRVDGGFLVQTPDVIEAGREGWQVVTRRQPTEAEWRDLEMAWAVCAAVSSNAIVFVEGGRAVGIGAGQQSRVDAAELAAAKAAGRARGGACASDAFFPFRDGLDVAAGAGVATVIQPGGSVRDPELIAAADEHGMAMVFTGRRHFRH